MSAIATASSVATTIPSFSPVPTVSFADLVKGRFDPAEEAFFPIVRPGNGQREQRTTRRRALGGEVGQIHRD